MDGILEDVGRNAQKHNLKYFYKKIKAHNTKSRIKTTIKDEMAKQSDS